MSGGLRTTSVTYAYDHYTVLKDISLRVGAGVMNCNVVTERLQLPHEIHDFGVTDIRTVLFERDSENQEPRPVGAQTLLQHRLDDIPSNIRGHAVIYAPAGENHFRVKAHLLRLVRQIVGIDTDAVTADEPWSVVMEIPLSLCCLEHFAHLYAEAPEQQCEFVR